jgi:hypothetical protein
VTINVQFNLPEPARLDSNIAIPSRLTASYSAEGMPLVEIDVAVVDGVPVCDAIRVMRRDGAASLEASELSRIPITEIVDVACRRFGMVLVDVRPGGLDEEGRQTTITQYRLADVVGEDAQQVRRAVTTARRRRTITDRLLRDVARLYRADPDAPTKNVARELHVSAAQASRYVKAARERGILEEWS